MSVKSILKHPATLVILGAIAGYYIAAMQYKSTGAISAPGVN